MIATADIITTAASAITYHHQYYNHSSHLVSNNHANQQNCGLSLLSFLMTTIKIVFLVSFFLLAFHFRVFPLTSTAILLKLLSHQGAISTTISRDNKQDKMSKQKQSNHCPPLPAASKCESSLISLVRR